MGKPVFFLNWIYTHVHIPKPWGVGIWWIWVWVQPPVPQGYLCWALCTRPFVYVALVILQPVTIRPVVTSPQPLLCAIARIGNWQPQLISEATTSNCSPILNGCGPVQLPVFLAVLDWTLIH